MWKRGSEKGFTLIEMMIAMFLLTYAILGLLALATTSIRANRHNDIRNTSVRLTTQKAEDILASNAIDSLTSGSTTNNYPVGTGATTYPFTVTWTVVTLSNDLRQVTIEVKYRFQNQDYTNKAVIYKHRAI